MSLIGYVLLIFAAIVGVVVIACFYIAVYLVAIVLDILIVLTRLARGQRAGKLWRDPFTRRLSKRVPKRSPQAMYSDRR